MPLNYIIIHIFARFIIEGTPEFNYSVVAVANRKIDSIGPARARRDRCGMTLESDYLRQHAARCLLWAADCFDLKAAQRLRLLAEEFARDADRIETARRMNGLDERPVVPLR
jgi:hypothetical protein